MNVSEMIIHSTALVETDSIGEQSTIGAFSVIGKQVKIGRNVMIHSHVVIEGACEIADNVVILPFCLIGRKPFTSKVVAYVSENTNCLSIGENTVIGSHAVLYAGMQIGKHSLIGDSASIREDVIVGDETIIGRHVTIGPVVRIGNRTRIVDFAHITGSTKIGDDVFISTHVCSANDNSFASSKNHSLTGQIIGNRVNIGLGAMLLPGVEIGDGAMIGAGTIVTKDVEANMLVFGQPAKPIKSLIELQEYITEM